jgi:hypothetical protein
MFRAVSHLAMDGVLIQQSVFTSSPPRWMKPSGKRPDGLPGEEAAPG